MAKAFKCDFCGRLKEGTPQTLVSMFTFDLGKGEFEFSVKLSEAGRDSHDFCKKCVDNIDEQFQKFLVQGASDEFIEDIMDQQEERQ